MALPVPEAIFGTCRWNGGLQPAVGRAEARRSTRRILTISFGFSFALVAAVVIALACMTGDADASTYATTVSGPSNWTSALWSCTAGAPGSTTCAGNPYPGSGGVDADIANISSGSASTLTVNSNIANAVTVNMSGSPTVDVTTGGTLRLIGTSNVNSGTLSVTGGTLTIPSGSVLVTNAVGGPPATLLLSGGTINNAGQILINGGSTFGTLMTWSGGTLSGAGNTNIEQGSPTNATLNMTGANGVMTLDTQTLNNRATANFSSATNALNFVNNATFGNLGTGTLGITADGSFTGGAAGMFNNAPGGNVSKTASTITTISVEFNNFGTVTLSGSSISIAFTGGGTHTGTFTSTGPGGGFNFSNATFNSGSNFSGTGYTVIFAGATTAINTDLSIPANVTNNTGNLTFGPLASNTHTLTTGAYSQGATSQVNVKLNGTTPGTQYDQIVVNGVATLNGTLAATLSYTPANGENYTPIFFTGGNAGTTFSSILLPPNPNGTMQAAYVPSAAAATAVVITAVSQADISVVKVGPGSVLNGQNAPFTVTVGNLGPSPATGVVITDTFSGATFSSASVPGGTCTSPGPTGPITCTIPSLASAPAPAQFITVVLTAAGAPGPISNTATRTSSSPIDPITGNDSAPFTVTVNPAADLSLTPFTGPATTTAASAVTYVATVNNGGPDPAAAPTVSFIVAGGGTVTGASGAGFTCGFTATTATCNATGPMAASSSSTINVNVTAPNQPGSMTITGNATSATGDPTPANNGNSVTTAVTAVSDLSIVKTLTSTFTAGQNATYSIVVTNNGPSTAPIVDVSDPTPAQLTFVSNSGACAAYPCTFTNMLSGTSQTILSTFTVSPAATGSVTNTASVASSSFDPVAGNNVGSKTTTIVPLGDLQIAKSGPATLPSGGSIVFSIVVKNNSSFPVSGVTVSDSPSANMVFASNAGACTTFPCTIASLGANASATIMSTFNLLGNPSTVTNTAMVSSSSISDTNPANNTSSVTVTAGPSCLSGAPTIFIPFDGQSDVPVSGTMRWSSVGATAYDVYFGPVGSGCNTLVGTVSGTSFNYSGLNVNASYEAKVIAKKAGCPSESSSCIRFSTGKTGGCTLGVPQLQKPANGSQAGSSAVTLQWTDVGADSYHVVVTVNGVDVLDTTTTGTTLDVTIPSGTVTWKVTAISGNCTTVSAPGTFNVCAPPAAPHAGVVGAPTTGRDYSVIVVDPAPGTTQYEFQEANNEAFTGAQTQTTTSASVAYRHPVTGNALVFFYRVRAFTACTTTAGPYSRTIRVVILPNINNPRRPTVNVPAGSKDLIVLQVFIPGETAPVNFSATSDRPWIVKIELASGILPPEGITLNVTIDPAQLPNGTFTATVIVTTSSLTTLNGYPIETHAGTSKSSPITINLVTPVVPVDPSKPTTNSVFIPAVGHLAGLNSQWRSDVRIYNPTPVSLKYLLVFVPNGVADAVKSTTVETAAGDTTALDDIIHNWYGFGEVGDSATGVLEVRPLTPSSGPPQFSLMPVVSSRTFNASGDGTVGQFIPGVPFTQFIGSGVRQSMQQIAQSAEYRTNFAVVEGSGSPASVVLSMFNSGGNKLFDLPVNLGAGEQKLLNNLLAAQGVSLTDGRMEVRVSGGDGKVTAYASVIDNTSLDPQFVPGATLGSATSKLYVVPGVADLNSGGANWRTDMRIYNAGSASQTADLAFYPQNNGQPFFATLQIEPNQVKVVDNVLQSLFSTHDTGGAVQITTAGDTELVVTGRTYNQTSAGTLGQFIRGVTAADGITRTGKALNILQVEDSVRFRTNVGVSEMTGKPATVEISLVLPDSKVTPTIEVPLAANEFRQFSVSQFGLGNVYNARLSVKVVGGDGTVTAYGSVIDQITTDPTFVAAQ